MIVVLFAPDWVSGFPILEQKLAAEEKGHTIGSLGRSLLELLCSRIDC